MDFCFDNTEKTLLDFLNNYTNKKENFTQITIYTNKEKPLFETKCDNIGFKAAQGKYCLEIQADMKMTELGYNLQLTKPFLLLDNVIGVSGRCAHNVFSHNVGIGKLGNTIEKNIQELNICRDKFYVYETCNRGPLLLDKKKLEELNFLDEANFFLDDSDHDLMIRAYIEKKYICGYVPIDFESPLQVGSTRNTNTYNLCDEYFINKNEKLRLQNNCCVGISKYSEIWKTREPVVYNL